MTLFGTALTALAMLVLLTAAIGVLRLSDALSRQHAATKAATVGVLLFAVGLGTVSLGEDWGWGWLVRLILMAVLLLLTLPLASHAVARAALQEAGGMAAEQAGDSEPGSRAQ